MAISTKKIVTTITRVDKRVEIDRHVLIEMLKQTQDIDVPKGADIYMQVPGGGDWSNMSLEVSNDQPVIITWTEMLEDVNKG
jgi:hypothetical protein